MGKLVGKEFKGFQGLVNSVDAGLIEPVFVQEARNVAFNRNTGVVQTRFGMIEDDTTVYETDSDLYWQNQFAGSTMLLRSGDRLFDNYVPIYFNLADETMQFCDYGGWIVCCNSDVNLKYKQTGMDLCWHGSCSSPMDMNYTPTGYAYVVCFYWAVGDYFGTHPWEADHVTGEDVLRESEGTYTSRCYEGLTTSVIPYKVLYHFDGTDASTTLTNSAGWNYLTVQGDAQLDTDEKKFDTASLLLDGTGDYVTSTPLALGPSGVNWSLDFWFKLGTGLSAGTYGLFNWEYTTRFLKAYIVIAVDGTATLIVDHYESSWVRWTSDAIAISVDPWHHFALQGQLDSVTRTSSLKVFVDGLLEDSNDYSPIPATWNFAWFDLGRSHLAVGSPTYYYFDGWIDELCMQAGVNFDEEFSPATSAYTIETYTVPAPSLNIPVPLGIEAPTTAVTGADSGTAGSPNGTYYYKVTFVNQEGYESNPSPVSGSVVVSSKKIKLTNLPISYDPQVVERRIYRTKTGGTTYYLAVTVEDGLSVNSDAFSAVTAADILDNVADTALVIELETDHDAPNDFIAACSHYSLLYGIEALDQNQVWECADVLEWEYFPPLSYYSFGSFSEEAFGITSLGEFLCVLQSDKIWTLNTTVDPIERSKSLSEQGVLSSKGFVHRGDALLLANAQGAFIFDAVRSTELTVPIREIFNEESTFEDRIDPVYASNMAVGYVKNQLFVSYTRYGQTVNDRTIHMDLSTKAIQSIWDVGFNGFTTDAEKKYIYGVRVSDGKVYKLLTGSDDNSTAISWFFTTKDFSEEFGGGTLKKRGNWVKVDSNPNSGTITVSVYVDGSLVDTREITGSTRKVERWRLPIDYDWYRISFKFAGSGNQSVYRIGVEAEPLEY